MEDRGLIEDAGEKGGSGGATFTGDAAGRKTLASQRLLGTLFSTASPGFGLPELSKVLKF
jgi:hypothetical protein